MAINGVWTESGSQLINDESTLPLDAKWSEIGSFLIGLVVAAGGLSIPVAMHYFRQNRR